MSAITAGVFSPSIGIDGNPDETQRSLAKSIADIKKSQAGGIEFSPDTDSLARHDGRDYRVALVRCAFCNGNTRVNQSRSTSDEAWCPNLDTVLFKGAAAEWRASGEHMFCGATCLERHKLKAKHDDKTPHAVAMHGDPASHARRIYEDRSKTVSTPPDAATLARMAEEASSPPPVTRGRRPQG